MVPLGARTEQCPREALRGLTLGAWGGRVLGARPQQVGSFDEAEEPQSPRGDRPHLAEELTKRTEPVMTMSRGLPAGHPQALRPQRVLLTPTPPCISGGPPPSSQVCPQHLPAVRSLLWFLKATPRKMKSKAR